MDSLTEVAGKRYPRREGSTHIPPKDALQKGKGLPAERRFLRRKCLGRAVYSRATVVYFS